MKFMQLGYFIIFLYVILSVSCKDSGRDSRVQASFPKKTDDPQAWIKYARNSLHDTFIGGLAGEIVYKGKLNKKRCDTNFPHPQHSHILKNVRMLFPDEKK